MPLTITKAHYSLYAVPKNIKDKKKVSKQLSKVIGTNWGSIYKKINKKHHFVWVKRKLTQDQAKKSKHSKLRALIL